MSRPSLTHIQSLADVEALYPPRVKDPGQEVVRIGPSPTGLPHIGTAMQAVINSAFAKKTDGIFIVRVEDTDQKRTVPGAVEAIEEFLQWMDIKPTEGTGGNVDARYGPYTQSERLPIYQAAAHHLVEKGAAYHCFCSTETLQVTETESGHHSEKCPTVTKEEAAARWAQGEKSTIRLRVPREGHVQFNDLVRGEIGFDLGLIDDAVLLKSDGFPTYHLASVVDDHFMGVTTIIRGEEWISSTPKHLLLYNAFGWQPPRFLHTVLLRDEHKRKLSKRSGDTSVNAFRAQGYLPEGFQNFLTRLVWAHPEGKDVYDLQEFAELVQPVDLPKTGPVADMKLLANINGHYLRKKTPDELYANFQDYLGFVVDQKRLPTFSTDNETVHPTLEKIGTLKKEMAEKADYTKKVLHFAAQRSQTLAEVLEKSTFFFDTTFSAPEENQLTKITENKEEICGILSAVADSYTQKNSEETWSTNMKDIAKACNVKDKIVFMLTRVAITGMEKTPPLYDVMQILDKNEVQKRLVNIQQAFNGVK